MAVKRSPSSSGLPRRFKTALGQIAHVNLRNHDSVWAFLFLATFIAVIAFAMQKNQTQPPSARLYDTFIKGVTKDTVVVFDVSGSMSG